MVEAAVTPTEILAFWRDAGPDRWYRRDDGFGVRDLREFAKPITIGSDVWVGGGAIICPGVTIGDRAVIGAGSVVTKDVPAGVVAFGNPCRVVREITE